MEAVLSKDHDTVMLGVIGLFTWVSVSQECGKGQHTVPEHKPIIELTSPLSDNFPVCFGEDRRWTRRGRNLIRGDERPDGGQPTRGEMA
jgi:hypothetical protein